MLKWLLKITGISTYLENLIRLHELKIRKDMTLEFIRVGKAVKDLQDKTWTLEKLYQFSTTSENPPSESNGNRFGNHVGA